MKYNTLLLVALLALGVGVVVVVGAGEEDPDEDPDDEPDEVETPRDAKQDASEPAPNAFSLLFGGAKKAKRQSEEEHADYLFFNKSDSDNFWYTEYPEINEPRFLSKYIDQTAELLKFKSSDSDLDVQLQMLISVQQKGVATFTDYYGDGHEMKGRTLSCSYLFEELNLLREEVHKLYTEENRPYSLDDYPELDQTVAEYDISLR